MEEYTEINEIEETEKADGEEAPERKSFKPEKKTVKGFFIGMAVTFAALAVILTCYIKLPVAYSASKPESLSSNKKINEILELIDEHYIGEVDEQLLTDYMFLGLISGLEDPYSTYFTEEQYEELSTSQQGHYVGIGVTIIEREEDGGIQIYTVEEDGPADEAGIVPGDIIKTVNGESVDGFSISEVTEMIQNAESDDIVLGIYREDSKEELEVTVTRGLLDSVSVWGGILEDSDTGYVAIDSFTGVTAEQLAEILKQIEETGADSLIIDLRGNGGGLVSAACDCLREFIPEGLLVYTEDKNGNRKEYTSESGKETEFSIAVLVDGETASAAEIFAGAMQDYGIAKIVGTQTFGKGIIQDVYHLNDGSVIRLTVSHYYTPNGNNIHEVGITPDIVAEYDENAETDTQLEAALEALG
ncbi:MAG TPA: S41 family peptidase [Candidatus Alectryocaccobium stercorigallinarum]|nr:S41 family peptidase [Candidatus Alectryocaccobium stercorigallinarum]